MGRYARERDTRRKETDAERPDRNDRKTRHRSGARAPSRGRRGEHRAAGSRGGAGEEGRRRGARRSARQGHLRRFPSHLLRHERAPARGGGRLGRGVVARGGSTVDRFGRRTRRPVGAARLRRRGGARLPSGGAGPLRPRRPLVGRADDAAVVRIRLVAVGRDKEFTAQGAQEYAERIRRVVPLDLVELPAAAGPDARDREAERILAKRLPRGELWAIDEQGTELTSAELASRIARLRDSALDLTLSLGGDEGLGSAVTRGARFTWSLSRLTLPHRLARVVALEQIYRAFEILRGGPYHK